MSRVDSKDLININIDSFLVPPGKTTSLRKDFDPGYIAHYLRREDADALLRHPTYPAPSEGQRQALVVARNLLEAET